MFIKNTKKTILVALGVFLVSGTLIQCTKDGVNAPQVSRALVQTPDSAVFSPFYDVTVFDKGDAKINDSIKTEGIQSIIKSNCASSNCHGGNIAPTLLTYSDIASMVTPGNPAASELFDLITTADLNKAMPPINYGVDLSITEKVKIYNWIKNGAKERPDLVDYRPTAMSLITNGCASGNCHNQATVGGEWARKGWFTYTAADTATFAYQNPATGLYTYYCQLKEPILSQQWNLYKDSVKKFYADTLANASFRPWKTFGTPTTTASRRGPLNTYDDVIMDIMYPKGIRSNSSVVYIDPVTAQKYYVRGDYLNSSNNFLARIDSTLLPANPRLGTWATSNSGDMAWGDGGLTPSEVALIKIWYFLDPNVPAVWKYGINNAGLFKYKVSGKVIQ